MSPPRPQLPARFVVDFSRLPSAANHVAQLTVGLAPVPGLAQDLRERAATRAAVAGDELPDECDVLVRDHATTVLQLHFHGGEA